MTVKDLIKILEQYPSDTEIYIHYDGGPADNSHEPEIDYDSSKHSIIIW